MDITILGIDIKIITTVLGCLVILLLAILIAVVHKMNIIVRKYDTLMSGKKGSDLEKIILLRFKEMDQVKANAKRITKEHKLIKKQLSGCYNKMGLVKYDAFDEMAGKLSFSLALLNEENSGVVINSMHSREGCYTYAKEIIKGESYIPLSEEEKNALERAKTVEEEIKDLTEGTSSEDDIEFDLYELVKSKGEKNVRH